VGALDGEELLESSASPAERLASGGTRVADAYGSERGSDRTGRSWACRIVTERVDTLGFADVELLALLAGGDKVRDIASEFGCTTRTVQRRPIALRCEFGIATNGEVVVAPRTR
jgi:hypothetical protein